MRVLGTGTRAERFTEDDHGVPPCPVGYAARSVELTLSCTPPPIPLLLVFCPSRGESVWWVGGDLDSDTKAMPCVPYNPSED